MNNDPPFLPWYLDTCNLSEVIVKDCRGNVVHYEDLGGIPDEFKSGQREAVIREAHANALAMVEWSNGQSVSAHPRSDSASGVPENPAAPPPAVEQETVMKGKS